MSETSITIGMAILELIELYHDDLIEYYRVVITICLLVGHDPMRLLTDTQRTHLEEVRSSVPTRPSHGRAHSQQDESEEHGGEQDADHHQRSEAG